MAASIRVSLSDRSAVGVFVVAGADGLVGAAAEVAGVEAVGVEPAATELLVVVGCDGPETVGAAPLHPASAADNMPAAVMPIVLCLPKIPMR